MKIALCQVNATIGDFENNTGAICRELDRLKGLGVRLAVFPELAICGYPPRDFLEFADFLARCQSALAEVAKHSQGIAAVVGCPMPNASLLGKDLFNSAVVLDGGVVVHEAHKALLPTYDIFDEYRYFEPGRTFTCFELDGIRIALTVCEDLWNVDDNPLYVTTPMDVLAKEQPALMVNIAASPFSQVQAEMRQNVLAKNCRRYGLPLVYVNCVGAQTEVVFDGGSLAMDASGNVLAQAPFFKQGTTVVEFTGKAMESQEAVLTMPHTIERIYGALCLGIHDYFSKTGLKKAVLGLSGGIDSAVATTLAVDALGSQHVAGLLLPGPYSSEHSVADAKALAQNLGIEHHVVPIAGAYEGVLATQTEVFGAHAFGLTEENLQARLRGLNLMAFSNRFGHIVLNTTNKSEAAVGYGTLYGDLIGGLSVLGDVYKTQVYALANYLNRERERIPMQSITKAPSAELRPNQKDSDSLPDYAVLDVILHHYIEERLGPAEIVAKGFEPALVARILKLVNQSEFKRAQTPPILRVSTKAFGPGRRLPIVGNYLS